MDWIIIISLIVLGWTFLFVEIFFIPGITVLAIIGGLLMATGIFLSFTHGIEAGLTTTLITAVLVGAMILAAFRSKFWSKLSLNETLEGKMNIVDWNKVQPGTQGVAMSRIAPSGKALFNDEVFEVHTEFGFIDQGTPVEVINLSLNKIFVKAIS